MTEAAPFSECGCPVEMVGDDLTVLHLDTCEATAAAYRTSAQVPQEAVTPFGAVSLGEGALRIAEALEASRDGVALQSARTIRALVRAYDKERDAQEAQRAILEHTMSELERTSQAYYVVRDALHHIDDNSSGWRNFIMERTALARKVLTPEETTDANA